MPSEALLGTIGSSRSSRWSQPLALTRFALVAVAVAQLVWIGIPTLIFGTDRGSPIHVAHEMGAFDVALAVGFLVAAWRPMRAQGMRTLVGAAAVLLVATAVLDLALGRTTFSDEAPHLLAVAGWLLLRQLSSLMPSSDGERGLSLPALLQTGLRARRAPASDDLALEDAGRSAAGDAVEELVA